MIIYFGADHRGFELKEYLKTMVQGLGYEVADMGAPSLTPDDDYTDYAKPVAEKVSLNPQDTRGILICGSGVGVDIAANRYPNVRSALVATPDQMYAARHDDNVNIASLAANYIPIETAEKIIRVFLSTPFERDQRFIRRLDKIERSTEEDKAGLEL